MKIITVAGVKHFVTEEHECKATELGLDKKFIRTRLRGGWTVDEAHSAPRGMRLKDYREAKNIKRIQVQNKNKKNQDQLREERLKQDKPHLFDGTPQKHNRSDHVEKLMRTSAFPKIRTDTYGSVQLI